MLDHTLRLTVQGISWQALDLQDELQSSYTGGTVLAFEVKGDTAAAWKVVDKVNIFSKTANFGDVRSTIAHPWTTTHGRMSPEDKLAAGITEGLLRLSIGLEYVDDLIDDLKQALAA